MATIHDFDSAATGSGTDTTSVITIDVTAGDAVYVSAGFEGTGPTTIVYSDSQVNDYDDITAVLSHANNDLHASSGWAIAASTGALTITATYGATRTWRSIIAFSVTPGGGNTFELDDFASATATNISPSSGSMDATTALGFIFSVFRTYGARDIDVVGSGYSSGAPINTTATDGHLGQYRSHASATSYTGNCDLTSSSEYIAMAAILREVTGGGSMPPDDSDWPTPAALKVPPLVSYWG
jgi:hypothetical protein